MARLMPTIKYVCGECGLQYDSVVEQCCGCHALLEVDNDNSLQQLKAEIATKKKPERPYSSDYEKGCIDGYNDAIDDVLRQLSAV